MNHLIKNCIYLIFLIIVFYLIYINNFKTKRENFISKVKLNKNLIVVMMNSTIGEEYKGTIKTLCSNFIEKCTYNFDENKVGKSKKVNITYDKSLETSTKLKNVNYLIIYEDKGVSNNNNFEKKFIKKWCSKKKKDKSNYIVIDYNNIYNDSSKLLDQIEKKFKINIPMKGMLNYGSLNNVNVDELKNIASSVSMNDLQKQFMNKI